MFSQGVIGTMISVCFGYINVFYKIYVQYKYNYSTLATLITTLEVEIGEVVGFLQICPTVVRHLVDHIGLILNTHE